MNSSKNSKLRQMGSTSSQQVVVFEKDSTRTDLTRCSSLESTKIHSSSSGSFDSQDIEAQFHETYAFVRVLGRGASAEVFLVRHRQSKKEYACKIIKKSNGMNDDKTMKMEIAIMTQMQHENVLRLYELYETIDTVWMVLEHATGGDLMHALAALPVYNEAAVAKIFKQILLGVKYLHGKGIVHRDLKLDNLLYSTGEEEGEEVQVKIADFGLSAMTSSSGSSSSSNSSKKSSKQLKEMWGTVEYFAPEVYDRAYGSQADVWSLGCILYEMLTGELAFPYREMQPSFYDKVSSKLMQKKDLRGFENKPGFIFLSAGARDLVKKMLKRNPAKRFNIEECLAHPWLSGEKVTEPRYFEELLGTKQIIAQRTQRRLKRHELMRKEIRIPVQSSFIAASSSNSMVLVQM